VIDRVIAARLAEGADITSKDPLRGRGPDPIPAGSHARVAHPKPTKPLHFKSALALEQAMRWAGDVRQGMTHAAIGKRDGCSQVYVTRTLGLLRLPEDTKRGLLERSPLFGGLSTKEAMNMVRTPKHLRTEGVEPSTFGL
jgi:hypothetical protein